MTRTSGRAAIGHGARAALGSALVAAACWGSLLALSGLLSHGRWVGASTLTVVALAAVTAGVRSITRSWWAPTLVGSLVAVAGLLIAYGTPPGRMQVVPDTGSFGRVLALAREAVTLIDAAFVPMAPARPVEMLVVAGAAAVVLLTDLVALGLGAPAWSGLVLVSLWTPAVLLGFPAPTSALIWTALAYLLLLALSVTPTTLANAQARRTAWTLGAAAAVVVGALTFGPLVAASPGWATLDLPNLGSGPVGPLRLSDDLDLRESLGQRSGQVVLRYTVGAVGAPAGEPTPSSPERLTPEEPLADARLVGPLRAFTLQDFDGRRWQRSEEAELTGWPSGELLSSDAALLGTTPNADLGTLARVDVTIGALREQRLPVSTFPRTVEVGGAWLYDAARDEVIGERSTTTDMAYEMTVQVPVITADSLRRDADVVVRGLDDFLVVPETEHSEEIRALALEITSDADGRYEQALALQSYLRDAQNFQYDTRVAPAQSDDAVWDFLEARRGYCVQFATAMSMLARTLGIPARLGVGFLPGTPDQDRVYTVTGKQSHAWPELYFPGTGWVRFEPTPAIQSGAPPVWSDPLVFATTAPSAPGFTAGPGATAGATSTQTSGPLIAGPDSGEGVPGELVAVGVLLLLLLAVAGTAVAVRRARGVPPLTAESAWARLRARLSPFDIVWTDAQTPRQAVEVVRRRVVELRGEPLTGTGDAALLALATELQRDRYAPQPSAVPPEELEAWVGRVLADVTRAVDTVPVEPGARAAQ